MASAGCLACSFSAEVCAFVGSLERFAPTIPPKSAVLLAVDSQSLLSALEAGPLRTTEDFTDRIWALLLALADRECLCVLQFVYSHVGFPPAIQRLMLWSRPTWTRTPPPLDHDGAAIWYVDVVRAIRRFLILRWLSSVDDARTRLCGKARAPLR